VRTGPSIDGLRARAAPDHGQSSLLIAAWLAKV
jgi:hypothetical protein